MNRIDLIARILKEVVNDLIVRNTIKKLYN